MWTGCNLNFVFQGYGHITVNTRHNIDSKENNFT